MIQEEDSAAGSAVVKMGTVAKSAGLAAAEESAYQSAGSAAGLAAGSAAAERWANSLAIPAKE